MARKSTVKSATRINATEEQMQGFYARAIEAAKVGKTPADLEREAKQAARKHAAQVKQASKVPASKQADIAYTVARIPHARKLPWQVMRPSHRALGILSGTFLSRHASEAEARTIAQKATQQLKASVAASARTQAARKARKAQAVKQAVQDTVKTAAKVYAEKRAPEHTVTPRTVGTERTRAQRAAEKIPTPTTPTTPVSPMHARIDRMLRDLREASKLEYGTSGTVAREWHVAIRAMRADGTLYEKWNNGTVRDVSQQCAALRTVQYLQSKHIHFKWIRVYADGVNPVDVENDNASKLERRVMRPVARARRVKSSKSA